MAFSQVSVQALHTPDTWIGKKKKKNAWQFHAIPVRIQFTRVPFSHHKTPTNVNVSIQQRKQNSMDVVALQIVRGLAPMTLYL